jgi:hypothetical protein
VTDKKPSVLIRATVEELEAWENASEEAGIAREKWIREVLNSAAGYKPKRARRHPSIKP